MFDKQLFIEIIDRLNSPTYGAASSELQFAAFQASESLEGSSRVSYEELQSTHVTTLRDTISMLEADAAKILVLHDTIQKRMRVAKSYHHRAVAMLAPINKLPAEVLARIFNAGKHLELNFSPRVSWVAKRWRDVALSTPELWNRIPVSHLSRVSTYIARAGSVPLDIEIDARTYRVTTFELAESISILEKESHRWRDLKALLDDHDQAQFILRPLARLSTNANRGSGPSQLYGICLGVHYPSNPISRVYESLLRLRPIASLQTIELLGARLELSPFITLTTFENMRTLSMSQVENLHLYTHLFNPLSAMPRLASLVLDQCDFHALTDDDSSPSIILQELSILELVDISNESANAIFASIHAPGLRTFGWYPSRGQHPSVLDWALIQTRYPTVSVLKLHNIQPSVTQPWLRWLEGLPGLQVLALIFDQSIARRDGAKNARNVLKVLSQSNTRFATLHKLKIGELDGDGLGALRSVILANAGLKTGKVTALLQPQSDDTKLRREFTEWAEQNSIPAHVRESPQDDTNEDDREGSDEDSD